MEQRTASLDLTDFTEKINRIRAAISDVVVGQERVADLLLAAILARGHILIEGVPGVAKTLTARLLAALIDADFSRIQFTPDLMPSDVLGTSVFNMKTSEFDFHRGPIFADIVLADEINRAPAKTQAALFEVMEERQATIDGTTYPMSPIYTILATQNPVEHEGTYKLPEAQLDRFMFKVMIGYPAPADEARMLNAVINSSNNDLLSGSQPAHVFQPQQIEQLKKLVAQVGVDPQIIDYTVRLVAATRDWPALSVGAGPRAGIALISCARAYALLAGRDFVTPDDIKAIWLPAMRHRVRLSTQMEMEGIQVEQVLNELAASVPAPRL